jgi:hypothetical protein
MASNSFPITSRYYGLLVNTLTTPSGDQIAYLDRRFVPSPDQFALLELHTVVQGERPDLVAYQQFNDAEQFWRICDANGVLRPEELTETVGRQIRITLPQGVPGTPNA